MADEHGVAMFVLSADEQEQIECVKRVRHWSLSGSADVSAKAEENKQ